MSEQTSESFLALDLQVQLLASILDVALGRLERVENAVRVIGEDETLPMDTRMDVASALRRVR